MSTREIVERLHLLRTSIEAQGGEPVCEIRAPVALALFDVMNALGLPAEAQVYVLGADNALRLRRDYGVEWEEV